MNQPQETPVRLTGCEAQTCGSPSRPASGWKHRLRAAIVAQFGHPRGALGRLAGFFMARRLSNVERSRWTVSLLDIQPCDRVLEVGCGPGVAIADASRYAVRGLIHGLDHSAAMIRQASKRNAEAIRAGRVRLTCGSTGELSDGDGRFDKIFSVNSIAFWPRPVDDLRALRRLLEPGGKIAITEQPRSKDATDATARSAGRHIAEQLQQAGFSVETTKLLDLGSVPAACVIGRRDAAGR